MKNSSCKDLINIILGRAENVCFLCLESKDTFSDFEQTFEILNEFGKTIITLKLIVEKVINFYVNVTLNQACDDCTELLLKMYIMHTRNESLSTILSNIIKNVDSEIVENYAGNLKALRINLNLKSSKETLAQNQKIKGKKNTENLNSEATICELCGKDCKTNKSLKSHSNTHKLVQCPHCSKMLKNNSYASLHIRRHVTCKDVERKKTKHNCDLCSYTSWSKTSLGAHINKSHQNVRPFVCDMCPKRFYSNSNLIEHKITHTRQDIICDVCGEMFVSKKGLMLHLRLHTGVKPYKCIICELKFVSASRRTEHMKRKHLLPVYQCKYCDKSYKVQKDLNRHLKTHLKK